MNEWLAEGSDRTPEPAIDAVLLAVRTTPQERDLRIPWRPHTLSLSLRFAAAIAIVVLIGAGAMNFINNSPSGPGSSPSPTFTPIGSPSAEATMALLDTSDWNDYTSERYGFDIKRPPGAAETPSDHVWQMADATEIPPSAAEYFFYPGAGGSAGVGVSAWSVAVEPGTSLEAWLLAYCAAQAGSPCTSFIDQGVPLSMDGHPGFSFAGPEENSRAFVLVGDRVYAVTAWRTENDPSVAEFGGGRRLVEAFVSTMTLRREGPAPEAAAPALTETFTSERYGYSIDFPGDVWAAFEAGYLLVPGEDGPDGWSDRFMPPTTPDPANSAGRFRAASVALPDGVTDVDTWIADNLGGGGSCGPLRSTLGEIIIDGQTGKVRFSCEEIEATVVVDDRVYLFTLFLDANEPTSTAGGRALFEAMIATVQLTPESAEALPSTAP